MSLRLLLLPLLFILPFLASCARQDPIADFRPLQVQWEAEGEIPEGLVSHKDGCVIRLTAKLMSEPLVQSSPVEELSFRVAYGLSDEPSKTLYFRGICADGDSKSPECSWSASCDGEQKVVVKFHNGD